MYIFNIFCVQEVDNYYVNYYYIIIMMSIIIILLCHILCSGGRQLLLYYYVIFCVQEVDSIRNDLAALRVTGLPQNHIATNPVKNGAISASNKNWDIFKAGGPGLNNPGRAKKLMQFFGDEVPLVRLFLQKLGYEVGKYYILCSINYYYIIIISIIIASAL